MRASDSVNTAASAGAVFFRRASRVTPGGVHNNARSRLPHPSYFVRAEGPYLWDADGRRHLDCLMGNGAVILGHRHPEVTEAVRRVLERGLTCGLETDLAVEAAERFTAMFPTPVHVRFATTGTEAALHAVQMARAITGRRRIAKVEGGYHGWADELQVSAFPDSAAAGPPHAPLPVAGSSGTPSDVARNVVVLPFNQLEATVAIIEEYHTELAAVIVEPVLIDIGFVPPVARYLETLREATARHGILLIFDEILTGFRLARGGAQERFDVAPDLAITGKAMSNGFPLSAVYGRPDVMDIVSPGRLAYSGTFNGHAVSLAAACATLARLQDGGIIAELDRTTRELMAAFGHLAEHTGIPVRMQGGGGHFQIYFTDTPVVDYRTAVGGRTDRYRAFMTDLLQQGVSVMTSSVGHHALSAAHNREAIDTLLWACESALKRLAEA